MFKTATATEFNRERFRLLKEAERGATVVVEKLGKPSIVLIPQPAKTSGAEIARRLRKMKPDPETADAVAAAIKIMDEAR